MGSRNTGGPSGLTKARTIPRKRLLNPLLSASDELIIIAAPGGYGKSVLAEQFAAQSIFDRAFMVPIGSHRSDNSRIYSSLVDVILGDQREPAEEGRPVLELGPSELDAREMLREGLGSLAGQRVCLVLDDVALDSACEGISHVLGALTTQTHSESTVVVTTRDLPEDLMPALGDMWIIDKEDLRFREDETRDLLVHVLNEPPSVEGVADLTRLSDGHVALLLVLARHCLDGDVSRLTAGSAPLDVRSRLVNLALRYLDPDECLALHAAAFMGEGTSRDLEWVLGKKVSLEKVHDVIPLLEIETEGEGRFFAHALARAALGTRSFCEAFATDRFAAIRDRSLRCLAAEGRLVTLFTGLLEAGDEDTIAYWMNEKGRALIDSGEVGLANACLRSLDTATVVADPTLLLLDAIVQRFRGELGEAGDRARLALELAEHRGMADVSFECLVLMALRNLDLGQLSSARTCLLQTLPHAERAGGAKAVLIFSYLAIIHGQLGRVEEARQYYDAAVRGAAGIERENSPQAYVQHAATMISGLLDGEWSTSRDQHRAVWACGAMPLTRRLMAMCNESFCSVIMGRVAASAEMLSQVATKCEGVSEFIMSGANGCKAMVEAARRNYGEADALSDIAEQGLSDDTATSIFHLVYRSQWRRAAGNLEGAVQAAEQGMSLYRANPDAVMLGKLMEIEHAAVLVAVGDVDEGARIAYALFTEMSNIGAKYHALCADLVLVECALRKANFLEAITRLAPHADYIATESANLSCAFYIRAYPALLGALAEAMGVERIPAHLLKLLNEEEAVAALKAAWNDMDQDKWHALANRMLSASEASALAVNLSDAAECQVRLFGGMEVSTPRGVIPDRAWRKRKARTLFAMLVTRQGLDVSREQLFEQLWPDMEPERARNNFYVVWNSLKAALTPELPRGAACPYVESVGGLCRISRDHVHSDLDDFDEALAVAKDARETDDTQRALWAYRKVADLYQGELLSGDLYDEWFAPVRDRCRQQFGDAMLAAAKILFSQGEIEQAAWFLRRGIAQDSLREDLYQELLRCQIASGQRSAAVETYMSCLENMVEQLGLDPSLETRKLYDKVLAMEE